MASCGVVVVGGGVCGLWTLHALLAAGHDAWLIERAALGRGQTIASQGILHAGAKYRLPGNAMDASRAVADVQGVWSAALRGGGEPGMPDLSGVRVLSRRTVLWTQATLGSTAAAEGAKRVMRSEVRRLARQAWPLGFETAPRGVRVYEAAEAVLEPASLIEALRAGVSGRVRMGEVVGIAAGDGGVRVSMEAGATRVDLECGAVVLAAGEGNEGLLGMAGADGGALMQRRPLHQLVALGTPFVLNGHCLQLDIDKPALTVTTGELGGRRTWYFGGGPAEDGVGRSPAEQVAAGKAAVSRCLPWVDQSSFEWRVFKIDRAEGQNGGRRPDGPTVGWVDGPWSPGGAVAAVWPTKLVLAPTAAGMVVDGLRSRGVDARGAGDHAALEALPEPAVAERVW